jgi:hypothetical protein
MSEVIEKMEPCPLCEGEQTLLATGIRYSPDFKGPRPNAMNVPCFGCEGSGIVSQQKLARMERGERWHGYRVNTLQLTLREAASKWGMNPSQLSRLEQGKEETDWSPPGYVHGS